MLKILSMVDLYRQVYDSNNFPNRHNCLSSTKSWTVMKIHKKKGIISETAFDCEQSLSFSNFSFAQLLHFRPCQGSDEKRPTAHSLKQHLLELSALAFTCINERLLNFLVHLNHVTEELTIYLTICSFSTEPNPFLNELTAHCFLLFICSVIWNFWIVFLFSRMLS